MEYGINQLAKLSGVSARTLRYYDEIGLLKPMRVSEAGYRFYGKNEVDMLQQILFYRERGLPLEKIRSILFDKDFDALEAMKEHWKDLKKQQEKISGLIKTVHATIASMKGEIFMSDKNKFEAFKQEMLQEYESSYGKEAREKYGDEEVNISVNRILDMSAEDYQCFQELEKEVMKALKEAVTAGENPKGEAGQKVAMLHKEWLGYSWKEYTEQAHKGVVSVYLADERFQKYYDREQEGCAQFLYDAVSFWASQEKFEVIKKTLEC